MCPAYQYGIPPTAGKEPFIRSHLFCGRLVIARCAGFCLWCLSSCLDQPLQATLILHHQGMCFSPQKTPPAFLASLAKLAACHKSFYNKLHKPLLLPKYLWMPAPLSRAWFVSEARSRVNSSGAAPGFLSVSRSEELVRELWWSAPCKRHHHGPRLPRKERGNTHEEDE